MKIGLISDVHANLPALEAVLDDLPAVDELVCAGDVVGYNAWPAACLERVREEASIVVQGNHDRSVRNSRRYAGNPMVKAGLDLANDRLSDEQIEWLENLPKRTEIADGRYRLAHSHPDPDLLGDYVRPKDVPQMRPYLEHHRGIVLGHTHIQHKARIDGRLIVNPGSVGQPRDRDHQAAYGVLDTDTDEVDLRRVDYDVNRAQQSARDADLPHLTAKRLRKGK